MIAPLAHRLARCASWPFAAMRRMTAPFANLFRACRMAFRYRYSLIGSVLCSIGVALMWGANIGAVYPFVDVVLEGKSMHQWIDDKIAASDAMITAKSDEILAKQAELAGVPAGTLERNVSKSLVKLEDERRALASERAWYASARPVIRDWLPATPFRTLLFMVGFLIVGTTLKGVLLMGNMLLVARVGQRTILDLQNLFFRRTLDLDLGTIGKNGTGDLVGRIRGETAAIGGAVTTLFGKLMLEPLKMTACLVGAAAVNWRLLLLSIVICPIAGAAMIRLARSSKRANRRSMEESAKLMNRLFQSLTYIKIVKAFTMEPHERQRFRSTAREVYLRGMRIAFYGSLARINNEVLGIGVICLSLLAGGYLVLEERTDLFGIPMSDTPITAGQLLLFYAYLIGAADPIRKMGDVYNLMQTGIVAADRVFPLIDRRSAVVEPRHPRPLPATSAAVEFRGVRFAYPGGADVLKGIDLTIRAGETLAIVGPNGCGKSTLVNLLPRFFDVGDGAILLDGHDLREYRSKGLRRYIGCVTQQTMLFDDTILANIRYGSPCSTTEDAIRAARQAHAHGFVSALEKGYETRVGEHGGRLSGGQRQRISLARAILRDPKLLILDEATSQIDPESEMAIHEALAEFVRGRTTIMITHRLSTLDLADRILVMDDGRVVDLGSHAELMGRCAAYRRLRQTELREAA
ncbi:MAG TPA: ABC transporter ATP-binding protein [Pirellulaceae bacterium]|nr:ABC transporter ATP-binding protein [Pirellulaceae bacterium]